MPVNVQGGALEYTAVLTTDQFKTQLNEIENGIRRLSQTSKENASQMEGLAQRATQIIGTYASVAGASAFIRQIVQVRGEFQKLEISFRTMLRSRTDADKLMAQVVDLAARTPFTLQDVGSGAKQLLAYGFAANTVVDNLKMLGDVAAGVGAPIGDIVYLYGTLRTQGRAYTKDIMQFTGRGIPIIKALADQFKVAETEVQALVEAGKVGFPEVQKAIQGMTGPSGQFFNLMAEQSRSLTGQLSNLEDAWDQMLNNIGQQNEGLFNDAIKGAKSLLDNYKDVVDILELITIGYGSYRAALIATAVAQNILHRSNLLMAVSTKGISQAQAIAAVTTRSLTTALGSVKAAIAGATLTGPLAALVTVLYAYSQSMSGAEQAADSLNTVMEASTQRVADEKTELDRLQAILKSDTTTREEKESVVKSLNDRMGETVATLDSEGRLLGNSQAAIDARIEKLREWTLAEAALAETKRLQNEIMQLETRGADALGIGEQIGQRLELLMGSLNKGDISFWEAAFTEEGWKKAAVNDKMSQLDTAMQALQDKHGAGIQKLLTGGFDKKDGTTSTTTPVAADDRDTIQALDDKIRKLKEYRDTNVKTSEEVAAWNRTIAALEKERAKLSGEALKGDKQATRDRKKLMEDLLELEKEARLNGLPEEARALEAIEEKYRALKTEAERLGAGPGVLSRIENIRGADKRALEAQKEMELFTQNLDEQQAIFQRYEEQKKTIGVDATREMFRQNTAGFETYMEYLRNEMAKLQNDSSPEGLLKKEAIGKTILQQERQARQQSFNEEKDLLAKVMGATETHEQQKARLREQYDREVVALFAVTDEQDRERRIQVRTELLNQELDAVDRNAQQQGAVYKRLSEDIANYSRQALRTHLGELKKQLLNRSSLPPDVVQDLENKIQHIEDLLLNTSEAAEKAEDALRFSNVLGQAAGAFNDMAAAVGEINEGLGQTIGAIGQVAGLASNAYAAMADFSIAAESFKSGDLTTGMESMMSGIGSVVSAVNTIIEQQAANERSRAEAKKEVLDFQTQMITGEQEMDRILRERERERVKENKTRLEGLRAEKALLEDQRKISQQRYEEVLKSLQQEQYVAGKDTKGGGVAGVIGQVIGGQLSNIFGLGRTKVDEEFKSLANLTYEEIERLFQQGQLTEKAEALFEQLRAIREEGVDVDRMLQESAQAMREIFTGTTAESIADSIIQGFRDGKRTMEDFAGDFEAMMQNAILNSLKFSALEKPIQQFYEDFAALSESEGVLSESESAQLRERFAGIINDFGQQFEDLQDITGQTFDKPEGSENALGSAIRGITAQQADLLAGQFGALRLTAVSQLQTMLEAIVVLRSIEANTRTLYSIDRRLQTMTDQGVLLRAS